MAISSFTLTSDFATLSPEPVVRAAIAVARAGDARGLDDVLATWGVRERKAEPAQLLERDNGAQWNDTSSVPQPVVDYSIERDVTPPTPAQWAKLSPLQRFAIFKLTRPGHTNENFVPAMREFGLIQ